MKTLAAARRPQTEKIGIISQFILSLFSRDVDSYRNTLAVSVITVSYTHLDVYKRQLLHCFEINIPVSWSVKTGMFLKSE